MFVCASPQLNLTAAAAGTVITEVRHKSYKKRWERKSKAKFEVERAEKVQRRQDC